MQVVDCGTTFPAPPALQKLKLLPSSRTRQQRQPQQLHHPLLPSSLPADWLQQLGRPLLRLLRGKSQRQHPHSSRLSSSSSSSSKLPQQQSRVLRTMGCSSLALAIRALCPWTQQLSPLARGSRSRKHSSRSRSSSNLNLRVRLRLQPLPLRRCMLPQFLLHLLREHCQRRRTMMLSKRVPRECSRTPPKF